LGRSIGSNGQNTLLDQRISIKRSLIATTEEKRADVDCLGKVYLTGMLTEALPDDYVRGNHHGEIVHNQLCVDFLYDELRSFRVEIEETNCVLQLSEGCLDTPAEAIDFLQYNYWEHSGIQVCDQGLVTIFGRFETNDTEGNGIEEIMI
jgi:hypothetical protein